MNSKLIDISTFKKAIRVAFSEDQKIFDLYAPHIPVKNVEEIVEDISQRIRKDEYEARLKGVYEKNELIGYYVYRNKMLISFALAPRYRTRHLLREFFGLIRKDMKGAFICFLWTRNERAIRWLLKNDMEIVGQDHLITQLKFKVKCQ